MGSITFFYPDLGPPTDRPPSTTFSASTCYDLFRCNSPMCRFLWPLRCFSFSCIVYRDVVARQLVTDLLRICYWESTGKLV